MRFGRKWTSLQLINHRTDFSHERKNQPAERELHLLGLECERNTSSCSSHVFFETLRVPWKRPSLKHFAALELPQLGICSTVEKAWLHHIERQDKSVAIGRFAHVSLHLFVCARSWNYCHNCNTETRTLTRKSGKPPSDVTLKNDQIPQDLPSQPGDFTKPLDHELLHHEHDRNTTSSGRDLTREAHPLIKMSGQMCAFSVPSASNRKKPIFNVLTTSAASGADME